MTLAKIIEALSRIPATEYPTPAACQAAVILVTECNRARPVVPRTAEDVDPAAGSSPFDFREERF